MGCLLVLQNLNGTLLYRAPCSFGSLGFPSNFSGALIHASPPSGCDPRVIYLRNVVIATVGGDNDCTVSEKAHIAERAGAQALVVFDVSARSLSLLSDGDEIGVTMLPVVSVSKWHGLVLWDTAPSFAHVSSSQTLVADDSEDSEYEHLRRKVSLQIQHMQKVLQATSTQTRPHYHSHPAFKSEEKGVASSDEFGTVIATTARVMYHLGDLSRDHGYHTEASRAYRTGYVLMQRAGHIHSRHPNNFWGLQAHCGHLLAKLPIGGLTNQLIGFMSALLLAGLWNLTLVQPLVYRHLYQAHHTLDLLPLNEYLDTAHLMRVLHRDNTHACLRGSHSCSADSNHLNISLTSSLPLPPPFSPGLLTSSPQLPRIKSFTQWPRNLSQIVQIHHQLQKARTTNGASRNDTESDPYCSIELQASVPSGPNWSVQWSRWSQSDEPSGRASPSKLPQSKRRWRVWLHQTKLRILRAFLPTPILLRDARACMRRLASQSRSRHRQSYNALHLRVEADWLMHTHPLVWNQHHEQQQHSDDSHRRDTLNEQLDRLAAAEVRGSLATLLSSNASTELPLFVASGVACSHQWLWPLRDAGYSLHCLRTDRYYNLTGGRPSYHKAVVDQYIASASDFFVGRKGSSFSWMVNQLRAAREPEAKSKNAYYEAQPPSQIDLTGFPDFDSGFGFGNYD